MTSSAWEFCCNWYKPDEIERSIQQSGSRDFGAWNKIPDDVYSREFAEWLCYQYRLAMNKGLQLGNPVDRQHIADWKHATGRQAPTDAQARIAELESKLAAKDRELAAMDAVE